MLPRLPYGDVAPLLDILLELVVSESHRSWRRLFFSYGRLFTEGFVRRRLSECDTNRKSGVFLNDARGQYKCEQEASGGWGVGGVITAKFLFIANARVGGVNS